jgi:UDP-N-acetylmuramyl pentapeptide phosphotransferase/UDP-N-acetylglucosamine-1-phosphate transferase
MLVSLSALAILSIARRDLPLGLLCGGGALIALVSFFDDINPLSARYRFAAQALAALAFLLWGLHGLAPSLRPFLVVFLFWVLGYTNAFNFMDGINGIAAGQAVITGIGTAIIAALASDNRSNTLSLAALVLAGSALGFLPHNFPRARIFMGDVGSAPLGFALAALSLLVAARHGWTLLLPLFLLHLNYTLDTSVTLIRRWLRGEKVYEAHKEHFYQRLVRSGKSHAFATGAEMILQCFTLALALGCVGRNLPVQFALVLAGLLLWSAFFFYAETRFRRAPANTASPGLRRVLQSR